MEAAVDAVTESHEFCVSTYLFPFIAYSLPTGAHSIGTLGCPLKADFLPP
jgi:hypothetical protein